MSRNNGKRRAALALERGDRVLLPDGSAGVLVLTADGNDVAIVHALGDEHGKPLPPGQRYMLCHAASLVRG